jgi:hypothetical protein
MHDPSDDTEDEENQTTTLANDTKESMNEEDKSEDDGDMDVGDFDRSDAMAADTDTKPQATDDLGDKNNNDDEVMGEDSDGDDPDHNSKDNMKNKHENKTDHANKPKSGDSTRNSDTRKSDTTKIEAKPGNGITTNGGGNSTSIAGSVSAAPPPPPVLRGTLSYNVETRRHMIRGMWNYENSSTFPPQRFELLRNLDKDDDVTVLPSDGEFHGSFSLAYFHTTSKGKQKERSKVIPESGVIIKFTPIEGVEGEYEVDGEGTNQFGVFNINGKATPSEHEGDPTFDIVLRKRYKPSQLPPPVAVVPGDKKKKKRKSGVIGFGVSEDVESVAEPDVGPLPPPSESFPSRVVCLRGKLVR